MKLALVLIAIALTTFSTVAHADHVDGYYKNNGTYVEPYERSHPDNTVTNNYSYQGNTNPNTGSVGTNHYEHDQTSPYFTGPDSSGHVGHSGAYGQNDGNDQ